MVFPSVLTTGERKFTILKQVLIIRVTYGDTYTNFTEALNDKNEVNGFQKLIDRCLEEKASLNY